MIRKLVSVMALSGMLCTLSAADQEVDESKKIGGSGYVGIGMMTLDLDPLKEVVEDDLNRSGFKFSDNKFITITAAGYSGPRRNGFRIGGSGTFAYNTLYSDSWKGIVRDSEYVATHADSLIDSVVQLHNILVYGGLVVEKSFSIPHNISLFVGGMIGAGALISIADYKIADDAFNRFDHDDDDNDDNKGTVVINNDKIVIDDDDNNDDDDDDSDVKAAVAPLWSFDIHGGVTYSLTSWMHIGMDVSSTFIYSSNGFSYRQGSFMTVNPGLKLRLIFGNAV